MPSLVHLKNGRLVIEGQLIQRSIWFDSESGVFVPAPDPTLHVTEIDLGNRIVAPGFIDLQINGAYGFDFSEDASSSQDGLSYSERYLQTRRKLIATGTTSFLPTMTSQLPDRYHKVGLYHLSSVFYCLAYRESNIYI